MERITPIYKWAEETFPDNDIKGSEYLGYQHKPGSTVCGVRHEDVSSLSFKDDSLDIIVSNDVFEHVPVPKDAFRESNRVLRTGGGTDVAPYCHTHGGYVLNATIDKYAYATIETISEPVIRFNATDNNTSKSIGIRDSFELDGNLNLHQAVYNEIIVQYNGGRSIPLEMSTFCDAPAGSGLGSSSTLVVVMIKVFCELLNLPLDDYAIAQLAFKVEREICGLEGGRQDQYSASFGGFNFMEFYSDDMIGLL